MPSQHVEPRVVVDPKFGYRRLDPLPRTDELEGFYESAYVDLVRSGQRCPELRHLLARGAEADRERSWLQATLHADVLEALDTITPAGGSRLLIDVGCGIGEFVASAANARWTAIGLEPSSEAADMAVEQGRPVLCTTLERYLAEGGPPAAPSAVILTNVLEHVPDPIGLLRLVRGMLRPGGAIVARVPNDFNPLQEIARSVLGHSRWWIASPDHVNYFDHTSIGRVLEATGFEVIDQWGDFPMELFLLMGEDYVADPSVGPSCHARRQRFELSLDVGARKSFGRCLVPLGWGRNSIVIAVRPADQ